jgi:molybdenum cofactor synthesis domain-containing protein
VSRTARVITASTRAAAGTWTDTSGPIVVDGLRAIGIEAGDPVVVADGEPLLVALRDAVDAGVDLIVTTGGTGHTPTDLTPEMTLRVVDRLSPGIAELVRAYGIANGVPTAALSRGIAGIARTTLVINLPGSNGGARDGIAALSPVLLHALDQVLGGDHPRTLPA